MFTSSLLQRCVMYLTVSLTILFSPPDKGNPLCCVLRFFSNIFSPPTNASSWNESSLLVVYELPEWRFWEEDVVKSKQARRMAHGSSWLYLIKWTSGSSVSCQNYMYIIKIYSYTKLYLNWIPIVHRIFWQIFFWILNGTWRIRQFVRFVFIRISCHIWWLR